MKILILFLLLMTSTSSVTSAVLKHDISKAKYQEFEFTEFCKEMGVKDSLMISPKSLTEIECLNKTYKVLDFCLKKFPMDLSLTRGFVEKTKKKVLCEMSDSVMISVSCDTRDLKYCFSPKKGCGELKKIYANRLELAHYSMLEKNLNCYYSKKIPEDLNEI